MSSSADQHIYAPRFPAPHPHPHPHPHQHQNQSQHLPPSAWSRGDQYPRQSMTLPTPSALQAFQQPPPPPLPQHSQHKQLPASSGGWPGISGYMLPPPCSRNTTVSPPASAQQRKSTSPYALPPLTMPITPMTSVTPPMTANPAALHDSADQRRLAPALPAAPECDASSTISSAKRRRRANGDGESSATRRRRDQRASPAPAAAEAAAAADGQKKPVSAGSSEAPAADEPTGVEAARILEERRRRNASASARFRKRRNERERELVNRCVFLEQQLLQIMGPKLFEEIMRKAPSAHTSTADSTSLLVTARRSMIASAAAAGTVSVSAMAFSAASSRAPSPKEDDDFGDDADDDLHSCRGESGSGISVSALTAPKSVDDVWSAYLALSQQMAGALQRIKALENSPAKD